MPSFIIQLPRKLKSITLVGKAPLRLYKEEELEAARSEAYRRGQTEAKAECDRQIARLRAEQFDKLQSTFQAVENQHSALLSQFSEVLPGLTMEAVSRVIAKVDIDRALVTGIVEELLAEAHPGAGALEVLLNAHDLSLMEGCDEGFREKYPMIIFDSDPDLRPGDCMVKSRFGVIDGRIATKLENVEALLR